MLNEETEKEMIESGEPPNKVIIKKIKDLTKKEMEDICSYTHCSECPLNLPDSSDCIGILESRYNLTEVLEKKIEVKENERRIKSIKKIKL